MARTIRGNAGSKGELRSQRRADRDFRRVRREARTLTTLVEGL